MKRITILLLALLASGNAFAQEMPAQQKANLEAKAKTLYPSDENAAKAWVKTQSNAWESIIYMSFSISEGDLAKIKAEAAKKYPDEYSKQEQFIQQQAEAIVALSSLSAGVDAKVFDGIKEVAIKESNGDASQLALLVSKQLDSKKALEAFTPPEGSDIVTFNVTKKVLSETFPYDYAKQFLELQKRTLGETKKEETAQATKANPNEIDPNSPGAYIVLGKKIFAKSALKTNEQKPSVGIAVKFMGKIGMLCPFSNFKLDNFEMVASTGDKLEIKDIFVSKKEPVIFAFVEKFPEGIEPIDIEDEDDIKKMLTQPLTLVGMYSATNISCYQLSLASIRDNDYLLSAKTPYTFTPGVLLLDFAKGKLISFMLTKQKKMKLTDLSDRTSAISILRRQDSKVEEEKYYPRLDKLQPFEKLDTEKLKAQMAYLEALKKSNDNIYKIYTLNSFDKTRTIGIFTNTISKHEKKFFSRTDNSKFIRDFRAYLQDIINIMKKDIKEQDPETMYSLIKDDVIIETLKRKAIIEFYETNMQKNNIEPLVPSDVKRYRESLRER